MAKQSTSQGGAGITCPECGARFGITIPQLLSGDAICCTACGLRLTVDQEKSREALELVRQLQKGVTPAQDLMPRMPGSAGKRSRRDRTKEN